MIKLKRKQLTCDNDNVFGTRPVLMQLCLLHSGSALETSSRRTHVVMAIAVVAVGVHGSQTQCHLSLGHRHIPPIGLLLGCLIMFPYGPIPRKPLIETFIVGPFKYEAKLVAPQPTTIQGHSKYNFPMTLQHLNNMDLLPVAYIESFRDASPGGPLVDITSNYLLYAPTQSSRRQTHSKDFLAYTQLPQTSLTPTSVKNLRLVRYPLILLEGERIATFQLDESQGLLVVVITFVKNFACSQHSAELARFSQVPVTTCGSSEILELLWSRCSSSHRCTTSRNLSPF